MCSSQPLASPRRALRRMQNCGSCGETKPHTGMQCMLAHKHSLLVLVANCAVPRALLLCTAQAVALCAANCAERLLADAASTARHLTHVLPL